MKVKTFCEAAVSFGTSASTITRRFDALASTVMKEPGTLPKARAFYNVNKEGCTLLRDRGNIKCTGLMLPEHMEALGESYEEDNQVPRP